ncbi:hypothetical protein PALB_9970 [Pseudoalteromonas luteoviolacea B = ATCC 29581]|nr:hypothetical protein PALB_9970 [Pseudoalteromonas luteoviolacea B = ATCC 29581]
MNVPLFLKRLITTFLLCVFTLQSGALLASTEPKHVINSAHLQSEHNHANDTNPNFTQDDNHNINDCHHCGHCSGTHLSWVADQGVMLAPKLISLSVAKRNLAHFKGYYAPLLRPPIT